MQVHCSNTCLPQFTAISGLSLETPCFPPASQFSFRFSGLLVPQRVLHVHPSQCLATHQRGCVGSHHQVSLLNISLQQQVPFLGWTGAFPQRLPAAHSNSSCGQLMTEDAPACFLSCEQALIPAAANHKKDCELRPSVWPSTSSSCIHPIDENATASGSVSSHDKLQGSWLFRMAQVCPKTSSKVMCSLPVVRCCRPCRNPWWFTIFTYLETSSCIHV